MIRSFISCGLLWRCFSLTVTGHAQSPAPGSRRCTLVEALRVVEALPLVEALRVVEALRFPCSAPLQRGARAGLPGRGAMVVRAEGRGRGGALALAKARGRGCGRGRGRGRGGGGEGGGMGKGYLYREEARRRARTSNRVSGDLERCIARRARSRPVSLAR